jgi:hypothetical protein
MWEEAAGDPQGDLAGGVDHVVSDAAVAGYLTLGAALQDDGGDDETGLRHPADPAGSGDAYVLRDPMPMS